MSVTVSIVDDNLFEVNEVFIAVISLVDERDEECVVLQPRTSEVTIVDNDGECDNHVCTAKNLKDGLTRSRAHVRAHCSGCPHLGVQFLLWFQCMVCHKNNDIVAASFNAHTHAVAIIGFGHNDYSFTENEHDGGNVSLTVELLTGELRRDLVIGIITTSGDYYPALRKSLDTSCID